jgi:predicted TPR repeat methyltransferase
MQDASGIIERLAPAEHLYRSGRLAEAEQVCRQILTDEPDDPAALQLLALIAYQCQRNDVALELLQRCISIKPSAIAFNNLGHVLTVLGRSEEAVRACEEAIRLKPDFAAAFNNLGNALRRRGQMEAAVDVYTAALRLKPDTPMFQSNLGVALLALGRNDAAVAAQRRAVELEPDCWQSRENLAEALEAAGQLDEAVRQLQYIMDHAPDSTVAKYHLAALGYCPPPPASPRCFVTSLFNSYAPTFEQHLSRELGYRAPHDLFEIFREHLASAGRAPIEKFDVLDIGSGTGLGGAIFRPIARSLVGVDIAPIMAQHSCERGVYDQVHCCDVTAMMRDNPGRFDLILSTDLFIYIGEISELMREATAALRPGGFIAFSIEVHPDDSEDFALLPTRRYAQSRAYINRLFADNGLVQLQCLPAKLRRQGTDWLDGLLYLAQRGN